MNRNELKPVIGTLAHNRHFSAKEITEYTRFDRRIDGASAVRWLIKQGYIAKTERGYYFPTVSGWKWIEDSETV